MSEHILSINIRARDKAILDNLIVTVESIQGDGSELNSVEIYSTEGLTDDNKTSQQELHNQFSVDCWLSPFRNAQELPG